MPTLSALAVGASTEPCVLRSELGDGQPQLSFTIDESRQIPEMDETNNRMLDAIADTKEAVAESDEGNNTLTVTARCKDDD
jgi:subtilase family serine protease